MNSKEETLIYFKKLRQLSDKKSKLYYMLNGKGDPFCYNILDKLFIVGVDNYLHIPVIKICDSRSEDLFLNVTESLKRLENSYEYDREIHRDFLFCYSKLTSYTRFMLSEYDDKLLDKIILLNEKEVELIINQVDDYQQMYYYYINGYR